MEALITVKRTASLGEGQMRGRLAIRNWLSDAWLQIVGLADSGSVEVHLLKESSLSAALAFGFL